MQFPVGCHDFGKMIKKGYTFVDKTLFINAILQDPSELILITRPRRFGKTLNMSLLHYFFAERVDGYPTKGMFNHLQIAAEPACMAHQSQLATVACQAVEQIKLQRYDTALQQMGITRICKIGIAFRGKRLAIQHVIELYHAS